MARYSRLDELAAEKGFILVYPNGRSRCWPLVLDWAQQDLAFFDALYSDLTTRYNIDLDRVYVTGMSNGAYFSHVVGTQRCEKIAAIAVHSGGLAPVGITDMNLRHKYPVLVIHGDADNIVNVSEGRKVCDAYRRWGHDVEYVEIAGWRHSWAASQGVNERIWAFFVAHPRR
jgi:polyhydroxybutyrate depolymerase